MTPEACDERVGEILKKKGAASEVDETAEDAGEDGEHDE
jgi:hypothetical protein